MRSQHNIVEGIVQNISLLINNLPRNQKFYKSYWCLHECRQPPFSRTKVMIFPFITFHGHLPAQSNFILQFEKKGVRGLGHNTF